MSELYENIKTICERKGITGYKLCKDIGISNSILSDLKSGRKKGLSSDIAAKIADYLGVSTDYLLGKTSYAGRIEIDENLNEVDLRAAIDALHNAAMSMTASANDALSQLKKYNDIFRPYNLTAPEFFKLLDDFGSLLDMHKLTPGQFYGILDAINAIDSDSAISADDHNE